MRFYNYSTQTKLFYVLNILLGVFGFGAFVVGLWLYVSRNTYDNFIESYNGVSATGLCIASGLAALIITFIGCISVWINSKSLLFGYVLFIILMFTVQLVVTLLSLQYHGEVSQTLHNDLKQSVDRVTSINQIEYVMRGHHFSWSSLQTTFKCCGVDVPADWFNSTMWPRSSYVPDSCCNPSKFDSTGSMLNCGKGLEYSSLWFQEGCFEVYFNWLLEHIRIVGFIAIFYIIIEIFIIANGSFIFVQLVRGTEAHSCRNCDYTKVIKLTGV